MKVWVTSTGKEPRQGEVIARKKGNMILDDILVSFPTAEIKHLMHAHILKEDRFILVHGFRGFSQFLASSKAETSR